MSMKLIKNKSFVCKDCPKCEKHKYDDCNCYESLYL